MSAVESSRIRSTTRSVRLRRSLRRLPAAPTGSASVRRSFAGAASAGSPFFGFGFGKLAGSPGSGTDLRLGELLQRRLLRRRMRAVGAVLLDQHGHSLRWLRADAQPIVDAIGLLQKLARRCLSRADRTCRAPRARDHAAANAYRSHRCEKTTDASDRSSSCECGLTQIHSSGKPGTEASRETTLCRRCRASDFVDNPLATAAGQSRPGTPYSAGRWGSAARPNCSGINASFRSN